MVRFVRMMNFMMMMMNVMVRLMRMMNVMEKFVRMMIHMVRDWESWWMVIMMWGMVIMVTWMFIRIRMGIMFRMMLMVKVGLDDIWRRTYFPSWMTVIWTRSCLGCKSLWGKRSPIADLKMTRNGKPSAKLGYCTPLQSLKAPYSHSDRGRQ